LIVRPPHVNYSVHNFSVRKLLDSDQRALFMGLDQVKELTQRTIKRIMQFSPFTSLEDFLTRVDPRAQEADNLARVGALDGLGKIPSILRRLQNGGWQQNQMSLFEWTDTSEEDWTLEQKVNAQLEILGASLDAHPLELVSEEIMVAGAISTLDAVERIGRRVTVAGVRQTSHRSRTAKGDGILDAILFPEVYRTAKSLFDSSKPFLITGVMEIDTERGEPFLRAEKIVLVG